MHQPSLAANLPRPQGRPKTLPPSGEKRGAAHVRLPRPLCGRRNRVYRKEVPLHHQPLAGRIRGRSPGEARGGPQAPLRRKASLLVLSHPGRRHRPLLRRRRAPGHRGPAHAERLPAPGGHQRLLCRHPVLRRRAAGGRGPDPRLWPGGQGRPGGGGHRLGEPVDAVGRALPLPAFGALKAGDRGPGRRPPGGGLWGGGDAPRCLFPRRGGGLRRPADGAVGGTADHGPGGGGVLTGPEGGLQKRRKARFRRSFTVSVFCPRRTTCYRPAGKFPRRSPYGRPSAPCGGARGPGESP